MRAKHGPALLVFTSVEEVKMASASTISSKGQITVPLAIRKRLGVKPGDRVEFIEEDGKTVFRPVEPHVNPFEKWIGMLPAFKSTEEITPGYARGAAGTTKTGCENSARY